MVFLTDQELMALSPVKRSVYENRLARWKRKLGKEMIPIFKPVEGRFYMVDAAWLASLSDRMEELVKKQDAIDIDDYYTEVTKYVIKEREKKIQGYRTVEDWTGL